MAITEGKKVVYAEMQVKKDNEASDEQGTFTGIANCLELVDLGDDFITNGAFDKTLKDHQYKFPLDIDHRPGIQNHCGVVYLNTKGNDLVVERGILNMNQKSVKDELYPTLMLQAEHGIPVGLSIEYSPVKWAYVEKGDTTIREISELKLYKLGIVDIPMSQNADGSRGSFLEGIKSFKALPATAPEETPLIPSSDHDTDTDKSMIDDTTIEKTLLENEAVLLNMKDGRKLSAETLAILTKCVKNMGEDMTGYESLMKTHAAEHKDMLSKMTNHMSALKDLLQPDLRETTETGEPLDPEDLPKSSSNLMSLVAKGLEEQRASEPLPTIMELVAKGLKK